ncbi:SRPBCC family protein [Pyxidicoccus sp. MSG2]|uniref:SRPBCC family protein n=1 Tax=Pyxidicoccus sp. MSG2 TaxID=2996790 RepID=UPI00226FE423|nr:SRPBCC family protein [Pyxidicoccus sp. MSG2]MCY1015613.1 SRPBCC family protein [Pyxidicoccus sp. MSG2]
MTPRNVGKLSLATEGDRDLVMTRVFNAPRRMVFDAWTRPELLKRWLGIQNGWSMTVCEVDLKVGGGYRFVWSRQGGGNLGMRGVYREIVPGERIVSTEVFDDAWYPGEAVGTLTFVEQDGKTTVTSTMRYASKEALEAVLKTPMERGVAASYDKLEELLVSQAAA